MDGRQFDSLTRAFAEGSSRRKFIWRGAAVLGVAGSLGRFESASAARRGQNGISSICSPDGAGGYYRDTVRTLQLQAALDAGAIVSDCCAHAECGETNGCMESYCDFSAGACSVSMNNFAACERPGCANGFCLNGACADPLPYRCGDGICNTCTYDSCSHTCDCLIKTCYTEDYQCMESYCSSAAGGCVTEPINEGSTCNTFGPEGICTVGWCTQA